MTGGAEALLRDVLGVVDAHDQLVAVLGVGLDDLLLQGLLEGVPGAGDVGRCRLGERRDDQVLRLGPIEPAALSAGRGALIC